MIHCTTIMSFRLLNSSTMKSMDYSLLLTAAEVKLHYASSFTDPIANISSELQKTVIRHTYSEVKQRFSLRIMA